VRHVQQQLASGKRALSRLRWGLGASMLTIGVSSGAAFEVLLLFSIDRALTDPKAYDLTSGGPPCETAWEGHAALWLLTALYFIRFICLGLAPLADDLRVMRAVIVLDMIVMVCTEIQLSQLWALHNLKTFVMLRLVWSMINASFFMVGAILAMRMRASIPMQSLMWRAVGIWVALSLPFELAAAVDLSIFCHAFVRRWWIVLFQSVVLGFVARPRIWQSAQRRLNKIFLRHSEEQAAAGIAGLVGGCSVSRALGEAEERFRKVLVRDITFDDILDNHPRPELFSKSVPAKLGSCDAFISHSWLDDAEAKWTALQHWRADFIKRHDEREPEVWFDKVCIDQNNIDTDLRSLPLFLSGCRSLVVLCGPSYLTRLWCIVELFTFAHIRQNADDHIVDLIPLLKRDHEAEDRQHLTDGIKEFDAAACTCYSEEDKEKMLSIILAAYGDLVGFNQDVRNILNAAGGKLLTSNADMVESLEALEAGATSLAVTSTSTSRPSSSSSFNSLGMVPNRSTSNASLPGGSWLSLPSRTTSASRGCISSLAFGSKGSDSNSSNSSSSNDDDSCPCHCCGDGTGGCSCCIVNGATTSASAQLCTSAVLGMTSSEVSDSGVNVNHGKVFVLQIETGGSSSGQADLELGTELNSAS